MSDLKFSKDHEWLRVGGDTATGSADMTGRTEGHLDEQARGDAVSLNILIAETPSGQSQRRVGP